MATMSKTFMVAIVALAIGLSLAQESQLQQDQQQASRCDVSVSRSQCGALTRIQSGENVALVQVNPDGSWKAHTLNNGELKVIESPTKGTTSSPSPLSSTTLAPQLQSLDVDGSSSLSPVSSTTSLSVAAGDEIIDATTGEPITTGDDEASQDKAKLDELMARKLMGARFSYESGKLMVESTNGQKIAMKTPTELAQFMIYQDCRAKTLSALNLNNQTLGYTHVFQQNGTIFTFVDQQCQLSTVDFNNLTYDQAGLSGSLINQARQDNRHEHHHRRGPPPPPPGFGGFFGRMNPMNMFSQQQIQSQPQQQFGQQPPQPRFNNMMMQQQFNGMRQPQSNMMQQPPQFNMQQGPNRMN